MANLIYFNETMRLVVFLMRCAQSYPQVMLITYYAFMALMVTEISLLILCTMQICYFLSYFLKIVLPL